MHKSERFFLLRGAVLLVMALSSYGARASDVNVREGAVAEPSRREQPQLVISGSPAKTAALERSYTFQPTTSGVVGTEVRFSIEGCPSWGRFSMATGRLSGTPTAEQMGSYRNIVISVSNHGRYAAMPAFSIDVGTSSLTPIPTPVPPVAPVSVGVTISGSPATSVTAGQAYSFQPIAAGANGKTFSYSIANKPAWANLATTTGALTGSPTVAQIGSYPAIVISVSNGAASASLPAFSIQVQSAVSVQPVSPQPVSTVNPPVSTAGGNAGVVQGVTPTNVCTTAMVGSHATYDVGPGQAYADLTTIPFGSLVAGDVVNIYALPNQQPYKTKIGLRAQGTAANPVIINGVSDAACNKPILDFAGSATAPGSANVFTSVQYGERLGGVTIMRNTHTDAYGVYEPQFIIIQGLQLQDAPNGATYTTLAGGTDTFADAACLWIEQGTDITIRNNIMTNCAFGIFTMAKDGLLSETVQRIDLANNRVYGNGVSGVYLDHNFYVQASDPITEGNFIGALRPGALGSSFKSRSARDIIRRNTIVCAARCLDLVESDEQQNGIAALPTYGTDYVYSNTIISSGPEAIHYGGDNFGEQNSSGFTTTIFVPTSAQPYRQHLRFWNNTYTVTTSTYRDNVFALSAQQTQADAWGNTFNLAGFTGAGEESWLSWAGTLRFGPANTTNGTAPIPAINNGPGDTAIPGIYSVTTGNPIPSDPLLQSLN
jgi:hypothetical protein